jgi:nucleotide-binding universal stress UspA family protein
MDGSEYAECVVNNVIDLAKAGPAEVFLLRVNEPVMDELMGRAELLAVPEAFFKIPRQDATDYLKKEAARLAKKGIVVSTAVVEGKPAQEILDFAQKKKCDLIVMSTHGRSGVSRWALGSVADRIVSSSIVPVLVVAPKSCRLPED